MNDRAGRPVPMADRPSALRRLWAGFVGRVAGLADKETKVSTRGFTVERAVVVERLEAIGAHFAWGYNRAVRCASLPELTEALSLRPAADAGFEYEGAAMGLAVADFMTPGQHFFDAYIAGAASHHEYMSWVGLGWFIARLPVSPMRTLARHRSLNKWLAFDGYGFHEGYFRWRQSIVGRRRPRGLDADAARIFDQGLGRSMWFVRGAEPVAVAAAIGAFEEDRHADLWAGVGLAATYAGSTDPEALRILRDRAGAHFPALAQGIVFAAEARRKAGNPVLHAELACAELLGLSLTSAADIAIACIPVGEDSIGAYQRWRFAIQQQCGALPRARRDSN